MSLRTLGMTMSEFCVRTRRGNTVTLTHIPTHGKPEKPTCASVIEANRISEFYDILEHLGFIWQQTDRHTLNMNILFTTLRKLFTEGLDILEEIERGESNE